MDETVKKVVKLGGAGIALLVVLIMLMSSINRVGPGHVGIKVDLAGSNRGVEDTPVRTGWVFANPFLSTVIEYPTYVQTAIWTAAKEEGKDGVDESITFNSKEGTVISADISLSYALHGDMAPRFYTKFRANDLQTFTHGFMRNMARDEFNEVASQFTVEEIYGQRKEEYLQTVRKRLNEKMNPLGLSIEQLGFVGALRLPGNILNAMNSKSQAIQDAIRVENELRSTQASAAKQVAQAEGAAKALKAQAEGEASAMVARAEGEAKANRARISSITPELLKLRELDIREKAVEKWGGTVPQFQSGDGKGFIFQLPIGGQRD